MLSASLNKTYPSEPMARYTSLLTSLDRIPFCMLWHVTPRYLLPWTEFRSVCYGTLRLVTYFPGQNSVLYTNRECGEKTVAVSLFIRMSRTTTWPSSLLTAATCWLPGCQDTQVGEPSSCAISENQIPVPVNTTMRTDKH